MIVKLLLWFGYWEVWFHYPYNDYDLMLVFIELPSLFIGLSFLGWLDATLNLHRQKTNPVRV